MTTSIAPLSQDELKTLVGQAALRYVVPGEIVGVGTGSTVNKFIDALASMKDQIKGAVSSSVASTERLQALARGDEGFLLSLGYSTQRGYGRNHPFVGEIRFGTVVVEFVPEELGFAVPLGEIEVTECEMVTQFKGSSQVPPQFTRGYGLSFGQGERKAMAMALVDRLVIGVAVNVGKGPLFPLEERVELVQAEMRAVTDRTGTPIDVRPFDSLLIGFAREVGAGMIVRGLRAVSDFDYEFQMAGMNHRLDNGIETVFLMASERNQFISSRFVKEIARLGGDVSSFVPALTLERTLARVRNVTGE